MSAPPGPPPSYAAATSSRSEKSSRLPESDERRLPPGWVCRTDKQNGRQYYIDTTVDPPRSVWHHPLDDDEYLDSLVPHDDSRFEGDDEDSGHQRRQTDRSPYLDELPPREHQSSAGPSNSNSNSGFSGWAKRFGNGMEENFRCRHGLPPKATTSNAMYPPNGPAYDNGRGYNTGPDVVVMSRGRHGRMYVDDGAGYAYMGRRRRGGIIRTAVAAAMVNK